MIWGNPRWKRLLMWALRLPSPTLSKYGWNFVDNKPLIEPKIPTFKQAWTGIIDES